MKKGPNQTAAQRQPRANSAAVRPRPVGPTPAAPQRPPRSSSAAQRPRPEPTAHRAVAPALSPGGSAQ